MVIGKNVKKGYWMQAHSTAEQNGGIFLTELQSMTGRVVALDDITDADVADNRDALRSAGMKSAAVFEEHSVSLAIRLLAAPGPGADIGGIIYATDDLVTKEPSELVNTLLSSIDRPRTPAFLISGNGCANIGPALQSAAAMCRLGPPILVVTSDRARSDMRVLANSMSLLGDAAAKCTVTTTPKSPGFEVLLAKTSVRAVRPGPRPAMAALRDTLAGVREVTDATLNAVGWTADDLEGMLVGEYSVSARRLLASASGIPKVFPPLQSNAGHCHSADLIRGLAELVDAQHLKPDAKLVALVAGPTSWTMFALRYNHD